MMITVDTWKKMLSSAADLMTQNIELLTKIDSEIGDGDHGITVGKIAQCILKNVESCSGDAAALFDGISMSILSTPGGSACPLYGTFFGGFSVPAASGDVDVDRMKEMILGGFAELDDVSGAKVGDKTMMDALIPAAQALKEAEGTPAEVLRKAADAAKAGAEATKDFVSKFGRAKSYKERTLGHMDPGAVSMSLIFEGFARALETL